MAVTYLEFSPAEIPFTKTYEFDGNRFRLSILKNEVGDFCVAEWRDEEDNLLHTSKIVYWNSIVQSPIDGLETILVPVNLADLNEGGLNSERVSASNLGDTIKVIQL